MREDTLKQAADLIFSWRIFMPLTDLSISLPQTPISCRNLIGGAWLDTAGPSLPIESPYNGALIGHVPLSSKDICDQAVQAAQKAFELWRRYSIKERCQFLFRFRELMLSELDHTANIAAVESGKTLAEAKAGILKGLEVTEFALSLQNIQQGHSLEVSRGVMCVMQREPLGVVCGITPFNFPAMVPLWMIPIAIALGNCFILKPSEKVPLTAQRMGDLFIKAGLPAGVFSIVNGQAETATALSEHPLVRAVAFVGSTPVARSIYKNVTAHGKRALCLGGAKNQLLVVPDAEHAMAVRGIVDSFTGCAGQRCMAASLLIAIGEVDHLIDAIIEDAGRLRLGQQMGAIIDRPSLDRIHHLIEAAVKDGASLRLDGRNIKVPEDCSSGYWLGPTIIDHAEPNMPCVTTEIFGPVLTIVRVKNLTEALALEAQNAYGNATSIFTSSGAVARLVASESRSGMIGINIGVPVPREPFSFGGTKDSKFGSCDITGESSLEFWTQWKKISSKWSPQNDQNWMS
jgi:malonate-semialdehyde dehydrogenase (acetylating)/methylmalonate-semialdehyde dehydrogenase